MKLIILEGIASSGKTTLERLLAETLPNSKIVAESETLMPLINNRDHKLAIEYLEKVIELMQGESVDYLIIDRFHLTHAFRTNAPLKEFSSVEDGLRRLGDALVILLVVDPSVIKTRIQETMELRKEGWKKGVQGSLEEKTKYYQGQQEHLKQLSRETSLPTITIDTTNKDWESYLRQVEGALL